MIGRPWRQALLFAALGLVTLLLASGVGAKPDRVDQLKNKREATVSKRKAVEEKLRATKERQRAATSELYAAQHSLSDAESDLQATKLKLNAAQEKLNRTEQQLAKVDAELKKHTDALWQRLEVFYKEGTLGYVSVALGAADFEQFVDRTTLLRTIAEDDVSLKQQVATERAQKATLVGDREKTVAELDGLKQREAQRTAELRDQRNKKRSILEKVKDDRALQDEVYEQLLNTQKDIEKTLYDLQNTAPRISVDGDGGGGSLSGGFIRPAGGPITCPFGWRIHPITHTRRFHDGCDIGAGYGATIRAAAGGTVIRAGWMNAYGNAVMIDHGGGYATLYGHCSALLVSSGQHVSQGQPIGRVGSTGWSTGPHLHFSVYKNGTAVNPLR